MRYFLTPDASRPYIAGGFTFVFEPVQNRGGSWLGVLAVEEDSAASALASSSVFGVSVDEIDQERFDSIKKKLVQTMIGTSASPMPQQAASGVPAGAVRLAEGPHGTHGVGNPLIPRPAAPMPAPESVALQTTTAQPPAEALLDAPSLKPNRRIFGNARAA